MKYFMSLILLFALACNQTAAEKSKDKQTNSTEKGKKGVTFNKLNDEETRVIVNKGTERPFTGEFNDNKKAGIYTCKRCESPLYRSESKFNSNCGWPSFDDEIKGAVKRHTDADGRRTEILCNQCDGHLGHVFLGEKFTAKNTRHCVNSISMKFIPAEKLETAIFASGCFWGTEYHLNKVKGVYSATSGYIGGHVKNPTYRQVCSGTTGHAEAVEVIFDPTKTNYEALAKLYFETHDPTQLNGQGPDIGTQYRSEVFYKNDQQKEITLKLIEILRKKGLNVVTKVSEATQFWDAEFYHQNYYEIKQKTPYCHTYKKKFD
jgi:peptide methionine sulfoxide reductase msrA/msrB